MLYNEEMIKKHIILLSIVALILAGGGYWVYGKYTSTANETRYVTAAVQKGTLISSITGSGQVSASNQIDLKPKTSGDLVYLGVTEGQSVSAGASIAQIDARDAQKAIRD